MSLFPDFCKRARRVKGPNMQQALSRPDVAARAYFEMVAAAMPHLSSNGLQPNSNGLHFSAFPQEFGTAAYGGGDQANYRDSESYELQVSALGERRLELEHEVLHTFQSSDFHSAADAMRPKGGSPGRGPHILGTQLNAFKFVNLQQE